MIPQYSRVIVRSPIHASQQPSSSVMFTAHLKTDPLRVPSPQSLSSVMLLPFATTLSSSSSVIPPAACTSHVTALSSTRVAQLFTAWRTGLPGPTPLCSQSVVTLRDRETGREVVCTVHVEGPASDDARGALFI